MFNSSASVAASDLSAAMEQGCWCELQGAYFANWKAKTMVVPYATIGEQRWDAYFSARSAFDKYCHTME
jgi:hypothetical protein